MPELYPEDQKKVDEYLASEIHQVKRREFSPLSLLLILLVVLGGLTLVSYLIARTHGIV